MLRPGCVFLIVTSVHRQHGVADIDYHSDVL